MSTTLRAALLGIVAGVVSGLFGVGGGLVMVPGLVLFLSFDQHRAHGTSVAAIVASASAALIPFTIDSDVEWATAGYLLIGALAGAFVGARIIGRIPAVWLARAFVTLALVSAIRLGIGS
ncbi:MAG: sulfite exporter TauE/SafE family protein [Acidimicrobiia bacterium]|nr:MAG: sulfite exporter TauE/SafE family protein [Acidimicrobiia bacterium]